MAYTISNTKDNAGNPTVEGETPRGHNLATNYRNRAGSSSNISYSMGPPTVVLSDSPELSRPVLIRTPRGFSAKLQGNPGTYLASSDTEDESEMAKPTISSAVSKSVGLDSASRSTLASNDPSSSLYSAATVIDRNLTFNAVGESPVPVSCIDNTSLPSPMTALTPKPVLEDTKSSFLREGKGGDEEGVDSRPILDFGDEKPTLAYGRPAIMASDRRIRAGTGIGNYDGKIASDSEEEEVSVQQSSTSLWNRRTKTKPPAVGMAGKMQGTKEVSNGMKKTDDEGMELRLWLDEDAEEHSRPSLMLGGEERELDRLYTDAEPLGDDAEGVEACLELWNEDEYEDNNGLGDTSWRISDNGTLRLGQFMAIAAGGIKELQGSEFSRPGLNTIGPSTAALMNTQSQQGQQSVIRRGHIRNELVILNPIGQGASGVVHRALHLPTLQLVAVKHLRMFDAEKRAQTVAELKSLYANMLPLVPIRKNKNGFGATLAGTLGRTMNLMGTLNNLQQSEQQDEDLQITTAFENQFLSSTLGKAWDNTFGSVDLGATWHQDNIDDEGDIEVAPMPESHIVRMFDAFTNPQAGTVSLVLEYCGGGSLDTAVEAKGCRDEGVLARLAAHGLRGLGFLHSNRQLHRDIKPGNLLVTTGGASLKIGDFGISTELEGTNAFAKTFLGTMTYMSPERIGSDVYSYPSDVWSMGLSILSVSLGRYPFEGQGGSYWDLLRVIRDEPPPLHLLQEIYQEAFEKIKALHKEKNLQGEELPFSSAPSVEFCDFLSQCLQKKPEDRPTTFELLEHPFLKKHLASPSSTGSPKDSQALDDESADRLECSSARDDAMSFQDSEAPLQDPSVGIVGKPLSESIELGHLYPKDFNELSPQEQDRMIEDLSTIVNSLFNGDDKYWNNFKRYFRRYRNKLRKKWYYGLDETAFNGALAARLNTFQDTLRRTASKLSGTLKPSQTTKLFESTGPLEKDKLKLREKDKVSFQLPEGLSQTSDQNGISLGAATSGSSGKSSEEPPKRRTGPVRSLSEGGVLFHQAASSDVARGGPAGDPASLGKAGEATGGKIDVSDAFSLTRRYRELALSPSDVRTLANQLGMPVSIVLSTFNDAIKARCRLEIEQEMEKAGLLKGNVLNSQVSFTSLEADLMPERASTPPSRRQSLTSVVHDAYAAIGNQSTSSPSLDRRGITAHETTTSPSNPRSSTTSLSSSDAGRGGAKSNDSIAARRHSELAASVSSLASGLAGSSYAWDMDNQGAAHVKPEDTADTRRSGRMSSAGLRGIRLAEQMRRHSATNDTLLTNSAGDMQLSPMDTDVASVSGGAGSLGTSSYATTRSGERKSLDTSVPDLSNVLSRLKGNLDKKFHDISTPSKRRGSVVAGKGFHDHVRPGSTNSYASASGIRPDSSSRDFSEVGKPHHSDENHSFRHLNTDVNPSHFNTSYQGSHSTSLNNSFDLSSADPSQPLPSTSSRITGHNISAFGQVQMVPGASPHNAITPGSAYSQSSSVSSLRSPGPFRSFDTSHIEPKRQPLDYVKTIRQASYSNLFAKTPRGNNNVLNPPANAPSQLPRIATSNPEPTSIPLSPLLLTKLNTRDIPSRGGGRRDSATPSGFPVASNLRGTSAGSFSDASSTYSYEHDPTKPGTASSIASIATNPTPQPGLPLTSPAVSRPTLRLSTTSVSADDKGVAQGSIASVLNAARAEVGSLSSRSSRLSITGTPRNVSGDWNQQTGIQQLRSQVNAASSLRQPSPRYNMQYLEEERVPDGQRASIRLGNREHSVNIRELPSARAPVLSASYAEPPSRQRPPSGYLPTGGSARNLL